MESEDLDVIERAGRRCGVCHTGRHWRRFEVARPADGDPVVLCPACRTRYADRPAPAPAPHPAAAAPAPTPAPKPAAPAARPAPAEDRLRRALRELPAGQYSTERLAKTAGLNSAKVLARLNALRDAGEVQQVGKQWSTVRPATDLEAAFDRLQAKTGNLRIIRERERERVG